MQVPLYFKATAGTMYQYITCKPYQLIFFKLIAEDWCRRLFHLLLVSFFLSFNYGFQDSYIMTKLYISQGQIYIDVESNDNDCDWTPLWSTAHRCNKGERQIHKSENASRWNLKKKNGIIFDNREKHANVLFICLIVGLVFFVFKKISFKYFNLIFFFSSHI